MRHEVTDTDTAAALGSGDVPVLATPRLIAWMEAATVRAATAFLGTGQTTVGTAIRIEHRRATPVGGSVEITATLAHDAAEPPSDLRRTGARRLRADSSRQAKSTGRSLIGIAFSRPSPPQMPVTN